MAGANYMGGKRNAAKARVRDSTGRTQKRHFGTQRLDLALNRGNSGTNEDEATFELFKKSGPAKSASDITLAHARQNPTKMVDQNNVYIPDPIHISPCTPKSRLKLSKLSDRGTSSGSGGKRIMHSRVLQALDTSEPLSLRSAMDNVLSMPDLAGLARRPSRTLKRRHSSSSPCVREETSKRRRAGSQVSDMDLLRHESSSDFEEGLAEPQFAFDIPEDGAFDDDKEEGYSSDTGHSATWTIYPKADTHTSSSSRRNPEPHSISDSVASPPTFKESHPNKSTSKMISGNIFDYEDPWTAVGVMLGIEDTPQTPLKKRDFRKVLAAIPTPLSTPALGEAENYDLDDGDEVGASRAHTGGVLKNSNGDHHSQSSQTSGTAGLPTSNHNVDVSRNRGQNPFQIFSPATQSKPNLPNILHWLVPYSSDTSSRPPSSPTRAPRTPYRSFSPGLSSNPGRDESTVRCVRNANRCNPAGSGITPRTPLFSPIQGYDSGNAFTAEHEWEDPSSVDAHIGEFDGDIASDPRSLYEATHQWSRSESPLFGYSSSHEEMQRRGGFADWVDGSGVNDITYHSSAYYPSQEDEHAIQDQEEADDGNSLPSPMQFASPSNGLDSYHDTFAPSTHIRAPDMKQPSPTRSPSYTLNNTPTIRLIVTPQRPTTPSLPSTLTATAAKLVSEHSSSMHALNPSQQVKFAPTISTGARLDPRTKLSAGLDASLHAGSGRYRSPTSHRTTRKVSQAKDRTISLPFPRFAPTLQATPSMLTVFYDESPLASQNRGHTELENTMHQDSHHSNDTDTIQTTSRLHVRSGSVLPPEAGGIAESGAEARVVTGAVSGRPRVCLSLFADDEVESDSD